MVQALGPYILGQYHKSCMAVICVCAEEARVFIYIALEGST
jgi:hypothetical protein